MARSKSKRPSTASRNAADKYDLPTDAARDAGSKRRVITRNIRPPIPIRNFDWMAYWEEDFGGAGRKARGWPDVLKRRNVRLVDLVRPGLGRPLKGIHALAAIADGNAQVLAQYLRTANPVDPGIIRFIAYMLDPLDDHQDDEHFCQPWRLKFEQTGRGYLQHPLKVHLINLHIGIYIDELIRKGEKAEAAKQGAAERFGVSLRQANKALKLARQSPRRVEP
jgi:hypothetical protein